MCSGALGSPFWNPISLRSQYLCIQLWPGPSIVSRAEILAAQNSPSEPSPTSLSLLHHSPNLQQMREVGPEAAGSDAFWCALEHPLGLRQPSHKGWAGLYRSCSCIYSTVRYQTVQGPVLDADGTNRNRTDKPSSLELMVPA